MVLIRLIVLESLVHNVRVFAKHVSMDKNGKADALSRLDLDRFRSLDLNMDKWLCKMPEQIWPIRKIWDY